MTHDQIEQREIVEAYLRGRLTEDERKSFEDHFFGCDACFDRVQNQQRFVDGVRAAAEAGLLPKVGPVGAGVAGWFRPAFIFSTAAAVLMAAATGWMTFVELPRLRNDAQLERDRAAQKQRREVGREQQLAMARPPATQANLPLIMLEASRSAGTNLLTVPAEASQIALWIEVGPGSGRQTYRLEINNVEGVLAVAIDGLVKNSYGALTASISASKLTPGTYRARLFETSGSKPALVSEYRLEIRR